MQLLKIENLNLKQEVDKNIYIVEDLENKNAKINEKLNEWKVKYDEINEKYEFESGQHDNTLKRLNDLRSVFDGETDLKQLLQAKQQNIQELQSKITSQNKENQELKQQNEKLKKIIAENNDVHSSMKTRINVQRQIMMESQQQQNENRLSSNTVSVSIEEYQHIQQQLNLF